MNVPHPGASLLLTAFLLSLAAATTPAADAPPNPAKQAADVQRLLADYRKPATTPEQKAQIIDQLLDLAPAGPQQLVALAARDVSSKGPPYLAKFERAAADALKARWKGKRDVEQEVLQLRRTVLDVTRGPGLTKDLITSKSDPAMTRLDELMTVTPADVLAHAADLRPQRAEIVGLVTAWHRAAERLPEPARRKLPTTLPAAADFEAALAASEELSACLATPMTPADRAVLTANVPVARTLDPEEARGILILNAMRVRLGLGALAIDLKLCDASRGHSADMRQRKFFSHESPVPGKETPWKRAALAGTSASAENIFTGSPSGAAAIRAWWHSPGHHTNMLAGHRRVGLGRSEGSWTQMFGG